MVSLPFMKKKQPDETQDATFGGSSFLRDIKPKERYVFHSDYFQVDDYYACIVSFFHRTGAEDGFAPFWGINRIPSGMDAQVTTLNFEQIRRMGEGWLREHQSRSEGIAEMNSNAQMLSGNNSNKHKAIKSQDDLSIIAQELNNGAAYLNVQTRLMVKAPSLEALDEAVAKLERLYLDRFGSMWAAPYTGEQRQELTHLLAPNRKKRGKGFYFTSTEYAGSYSLVTHGLEDPGGEYVGYMVGDVNNSAVLFDVNDYRHHIVVASEQVQQFQGQRVRVSDMWGSKISQACLLGNGRVVHLVLNDCDLNNVGPALPGITSRIDMNHGDVNMFEMFGSIEDELSVFAAQMQKLIRMAEQAYETTDSDRSIIRGELEKIATQFYIDQRMWYENAKANRDRLRVVGVPHDEVPRLETFVAYLDMEYKAMANRQARDDERLHALSVLSSTFRNLLSNNGDLFNTSTNPLIDKAVQGRRVIYDFSKLQMRGTGIALAQLVNVIGFAVGNLGEGDSVIIHGAGKITDHYVRQYVNMQLDRLYLQGGRVVFLYDSMDEVLADQSFNRFDRADYTVLGNLSDNGVKQYEKQLGQAIPPDLQALVTKRDAGMAYIRRGFDNVVFQQDLQLIPSSEGSGS